MQPEKTCKQVYDLTPMDLENFPIWIFISDEEYAPNQDEATVKPYIGTDIINPEQAMFIVKTHFHATDGSEFIGYSTPQDEYDLGYIQPTIVTPRGQVNFWFGMFKPKKDELRGIYELLEKEPTKLFPLRFESAIQTKGIPLRGEINGFSYSPGVDDNKVIEIQ
jgi:hypothetical protein